MKKKNRLPQVNVFVNWLFCLFYLLISEGIFVSNQKYFVVTQEPISFLSYFVHMVVFIPLVIILVIHFIGIQSSALVKIGTVLVASSILFGGEYLLDAAGVLHHTRNNPAASFAYWYLLLFVMLTFNKIFNWKVQRV